jgi:hypothetical protein
MFSRGISFVCLLFSHEAQRAEKEKEEKHTRLEQRRNRLAALLDTEKQTFQVTHPRLSLSVGRQTRRCLE